MRPLLYLAAPYTNPDPVRNTHDVCRVAMEIYERTEWCPIIPHLSMLWHTITPREYDHWLEYDLHLVRKCDAIVRFPGESKGADGEIEEAVRNGIEVIGFFDLPKEATEKWLSG